MFKENELKLLWPFYLTYLIYGLSVMIAPFMIIYFLDLGFTYFQISIIMASTTIVMFLFEMPTGIFADTHGRKKSTILGYTIIGIFISILPFSNNFYFLLLCLAMSGFGMTFISGAEEAWVVDKLNKNGFKEFREEFFKKVQIITLSGVIIAPIIGGIIVKYYSIKPLWYIYGIGFLLNAIILLIFTEEKFKPEKKTFKESINHTILESKISFNYILGHKIIFLLTLALIFEIFMTMGNDGITPFLVSLLMPTYYLGYYLSLVAFFGILATFTINYFKKYELKYVISLILLLEVLITFLILFLKAPYWIIGLIILILTHTFSAISKPLLQSYIHDFIPEKTRATILSTQSMIKMLVFTVVSLIGGYLLDIFGPQKVIAYSSLFGLFAVICYLKIKSS